LYDSGAPRAHAKVMLPTSSFNSGHGCGVPEHPEIAVIDDDESFRVAIVESLSSLGYESSGYASAEEYIGAVATTSFACVVTDIHMPGMSGFELMKWLASQQVDSPVIMITARSDPHLETRAVSAGAVCLLRKPFEIDNLIECIERATGS
jgi:FixJ family two-component response regulator